LVSIVTPHGVAALYPVATGLLINPIAKPEQRLQDGGGLPYG
jgi:hypothetical protein